MNGFVISWFYPPVNSSEGLVTYKLLESSKIHHDVFTQATNQSWSYKTTNNDNKFTFNNTTPLYCDKGDFNGWIEDGVSYFDRNIGKYDFIMSRSMPPESHVLALRIKQNHPDVKWIASFGDPIAEAPYTLMNYSYVLLDYKNTKKIHSLRSIISPMRYARILSLYRQVKFYKNHFNEQKDLCNKIYANADAIILNSTWQRDYMFKESSESIKNKICILPHTYNKSLYKKNDRNSGKKIRFTFIGHLDEIRTPFRFLEAIVELKKRINNLHEKIEVSFYGNMPDNCKMFIINNFLTDVVMYKGNIDYFQSLSIMENSDWLLHFDANISAISGDNIFFAAKLVDYMGTGKPIFAVTMPSGTVRDILDDYGKSIVCYINKDDILNSLYLIINNQYMPSEEARNSNYDSENVAKSYDELIKTLKNN